LIVGSVAYLEAIFATARQLRVEKRLVDDEPTGQST